LVTLLLCHRRASYPPAYSRPARPQPRGDAGDVLEEALLGGTIALLSASPGTGPGAELRVIYIPAGGPLGGRACRLTGGFVREFLARPRAPRPAEYAPLPADTHFTDLVCASGHLPAERCRVGPARGGRGRRDAKPTGGLRTLQARPRGWSESESGGWSSAGLTGCGPSRDVARLDSGRLEVHVSGTATATATADAQA
jgi:hypothetical protein